MDEVIAYALRRNPDLVTARLRVDSVRGEQRIARAIPNPTFAVAPGNPTQYSVNQTLDVGLNRFYRTRAAAYGAAATRLDVADAKRQVIFAARQGFLDLLLAEAVRDVARGQRDVVHQLLVSDSIRFRGGDIAERDVGTTELQYAHAEAAFARADAAARGARLSLQLLMGVPRPDTAFRVNGTLEYLPLRLPLDSVALLARAERPDLAAAGERLAQSRALRSLATANLIPVPGINGVYQAQPFDTGSNYALGLSLSLPVFYWFGGERQRAAAGLEAAKVSRERVLLQAQSDAVAAADNFRATRTLAERYASGLLARAQAAVDMQRYAYEHGNASLLELLSAVSTFADTRVDYFTALHDYWVSVYAIDRAVGRDLVP